MPTSHPSTPKDNPNTTATLFIVVFWLTGQLPAMRSPTYRPKNHPTDCAY